jgi:hypothetical protein
MPPIKHTQLFDFPAYVQAIKDVKTETVAFGKTVEDMIKRLQGNQKALTSELKEYAEILKNFNVAKPGAGDGLKGLNTGISESIGKLNELKAVQAGMASFVDLNAASVRELKAEFSGLKKQYENLKPTQKDYAQQVQAIKDRIKEVTPGIAAYTNAIKASKMGIEAAEGTYRRMQQELTQLKNELKNLPGAFDAVTGKLNKANPEAVSLTERIGKLDVALKHADEQMGVFGRNVGNYKSAFNGLGMSFTQIARELPSLAINLQTFMLAISNNLPMVFDEIAKSRTEIAALRAEGQKAPSIWKQVGAALFSVQLLMSVGVTLLTLYGAKIVDWIGALFKGKQALDQLKMSQETLNKAFASSEYTEAVKNVNELTINIDLAKRGLISKDGVLKQYNDTIGKTTGLVDNLDQAEKELAKNAEAYVKMTLYKAAANIALEDAAKKAFEVEQKRLKDAKEFLTAGDKATSFGAGNVSAPGFVPNLQAQASQTQAAFNKEQSEKRKAAAIQQSLDEQKTFEDIAKSLQKKAAEISEKYKFDFFGSLTDKDKKDKDKEYMDFVRKQQAFLEKEADLKIKTNELLLAKKEISEEEFEKRKLDLIAGYIDRAIKLEESLGQKADKSRIEDYKGKLADQELEYKKFLLKLEEKDIEFDRKKNSRVRVTPVGIQSTEPEKAGPAVGEKAIEAINKRAQAAIDAENKAFEIIRAGRDTSFKEELAHLERLKKIRIDFKRSTAEEEYAIAQLNAQRERQLREETEHFIFDAISTGLQILQQTSDANIQQRIDNLETEKQRELALAGNNAAAREAIEKQYQQRIAKEKRKQAQQDKMYALFNVAINTAAGVTKSIAEWGMPFAIPFIALAVGQGLLQAALIASKPLPQFKKGTKNAPAGLAITGEEGFEFIERRGKLYTSGDGPTLTKLEGGEKIFTHDESKRMLERSMEAQEVKQMAETAMLHGALAAQLRKGQQMESIRIMAEAMKGGGVSQAAIEKAFENAIKGIPIHQHIYDERGYRKRLDEINQKTTYLNDRHSF